MKRDPLAEKSGCRNPASLSPQPPCVVNLSPQPLCVVHQTRMLSCHELFFTKPLLLACTMPFTFIVSFSFHSDTFNNTLWNASCVFHRCTRWHQISSVNCPGHWPPKWDLLSDMPRRLPQSCCSFYWSKKVYVLNVAVSTYWMLTLLQALF